MEQIFNKAVLMTGETVRTLARTITCDSAQRMRLHKKSLNVILERGCRS